MPSGIDAAPYVKAAVRDTKAYMNAKGGRYIPIGYSAADIASIRPMFQNYLVCGALEDTIDFFAINIYEWVSIRYNEVNNSVEMWTIKLQDTQIVWPNFKDIQSLYSFQKMDVSQFVLVLFPICHLYTVH
jgi:Glucanosyltransferase